MPSSKFEMDRDEVSHGTQGHGDGRCSMKFSFQRTIIAMSKTDYLSILQAGIQKAKQSSLDKAGEDRANRERKDARLRRITDIVGPRLADLEEQLKDAGIRVDRDPKFPGTPKDGVYVAFRLLPTQASKTHHTSVFYFKVSESGSVEIGRGNPERVYRDADDRLARVIPEDWGAEPVDRTLKMAVEELAASYQEFGST